MRFNIIERARRPPNNIDTFEEKYSPKSIDQILGHTDVIQTLQTYFSRDRKDLTKPFLFLYGPPGSGKSTLLEVVLKTYRKIYIDHDDISDKKAFMTRFENLLRFQYRKPTILVFENVDKNFTDNLFNTCYRTVSQYVKKFHIRPPCGLVCTSSHRAIKKNYNKAGIQHLFVNYIQDNQLMIRFIQRVLDNELPPGVSPTKRIPEVVKASGGSVRRCIQLLKLVILGLEVKQTTEIDQIIESVLKYKEDIFCTAHELLHRCLVDKELIPGCHDLVSDLPLLNDLIYSNTPFFLTLEDSSKVLDVLAEGDPMFSQVYYHGRWDLRDLYNYVYAGTILKYMAQHRDPSRRKRVLVKNVLNNLATTKKRSRDQNHQNTVEKNLQELLNHDYKR
jgi:energy-coupling factor transporter ATP-binding protein EcfA2